MFLSDLIRHLKIPFIVDFLGVSRYRDADTPGKIELYHEPRQNLSGKHILIVDTILDKGATLDFALNFLKRYQPDDIKTCVLLSKETSRECNVEVDIVGFSIPDLFVFGYGLDFGGKYRNLPFIAYKQLPK